MYYTKNITLCIYTDYRMKTKHCISCFTYTLSINMLYMYMHMHIFMDTRLSCNGSCDLTFSILQNRIFLTPCTNSGANTCY